MYRKFFVLLTVCFVAGLVLVACGGDRSGGTDANGSANGSNNAASGKQVQMTDSQFAQSSITIKKGESITLVASTFTPHIIANGIWDGSQQKPATEAGAPAVKDLQINGNSSGTVGPFTTAGTFKLYCTIHPGMNLTVVVQ